MFTKNKPKDADLDYAIAEIYKSLNGLMPDTDEYAKAADQLTKLYAFRNAQTPDRLSKDTLAIVFGNIVGILMIVNAEQTGIVTSKAISFIKQFK